MSAPHPFRPGELCFTRQMDPAVYRLPEGLPAGVRVRTRTFSHGWWTVELEAPDGRTWPVFVVLLERVGDGDTAGKAGGGRRNGCRDGLPRANVAP